MADPIFSPTPEERSERNWVPIVVGLLLVLAIIAGIALIARNRETRSAAVDPYAANLQSSEMKLSQANNFVGATVTYLDFNITNAGPQTVTGAQVDAVFKNTLGETVQTERLALRILQPNQLGGYPDLVDLASSPLAPGQTKTARVTLEHVSGDWNQAPPDLRFFNIKTK